MLLEVPESKYTEWTSHASMVIFPFLTELPPRTAIFVIVQVGTVISLSAMAMPLPMQRDQLVLYRGFV